jgi:hypothetical protein
MNQSNRPSKDKIFEILDDLDWHHHSEFRIAGQHISPEIASRAYLHTVPKKNRESKRKAHPHVQVRNGRKRMIDKLLIRMINKGLIEKKGKPQERFYRLIDLGDQFKIKECPCCSSVKIWVGAIGPTKHAVICCDCELRIERETKPQAMRAWNLRNGQLSPSSESV